MKFYWVKTNAIIKKIFSNFVWDIPNYEKKIYLTFDDGPTPEITEWTLLQLKKHNAKATFFCIGKNIENHPDIFQKVVADEHAIGNHTFNHLNGWKTKTIDYLKNIELCETSLKPLKAKIFRPPYGKIKFFQASKLKKQGYKIIMWDVLSADFDKEISPEKCLDNVIANVKSGSIIVFHDSQKAFKNLEYALPKTLNFLEENGYSFGVIN